MISFPQIVMGLLFSIGVIGMLASVNEANKKPKKSKRVYRRKPNGEFKRKPVVYVNDAWKASL